VGNSRIKIGIFEDVVEGVAREPLPVVRAATAIAVNTQDPAREIATWCAEQGASPQTTLLAGVNPAVVAAVQAAWRVEWGDLHLLGRPGEALLANRTEFPERVGIDRLFDAVATNQLRPPDRSAIVVGSGTTTTVNLIDASGAFLGGAILAGFGMIATALHERTALLPRIDVASLPTSLDPLGRNTEEALRSGLYWGLVGGVKELIAQLSRHAETSPPFLVLTGGAAPLLLPHLPEARYEPWLTLQGMALCAESGKTRTR
jgi:type III pantothenate kinase